jgi:RNA polymerase sigma-70 factor (ECF subfamily)
VFRYAWHLLGRREDAEDATQATFLAVHGALAGGTAVLESGAWVLRIARNECMGRLRQTARRPPVRSLDDGFDPPAAGGVEQSAELRDEMRTAQQTLGALPVPEREAFVLREWLGFGAGEAGLALGMTPGDVDGLAARARRSLVIAVGGLEPAISCAGTRAAMEAGSLDRAAKVHLLRCPVCRGVRRALRPPDAAARPAVAQRLSAVIPGFATGGGGILARPDQDGRDRRCGGRDGRRGGAGHRAGALRTPRGARRSGADHARGCCDSRDGHHERWQAGRGGRAALEQFGVVRPPDHARSRRDARGRARFAVGRAG